MANKTNKTKQNKIIQCSSNLSNVRQSSAVSELPSKIVRPATLQLVILNDCPCQNFSSSVKIVSSLSAAI